MVGSVAMSRSMRGIVLGAVCLKRASKATSEFTQKISLYIPMGVTGPSARTVAKSLYSKRSAGLMLTVKNASARGSVERDAASEAQS